MKTKRYAACFLFVFLLVPFISQAHATSIVYDEVIFEPVKITTIEGRFFLEIHSLDGNMYEIPFEDYNSLKAKIKQALQETNDKKKHIAFYLKLGTIVDVSSFYKEDVHIFSDYAETKTYYAISASFMNADVRLRLKVTKEENPLSYKISEKFLEERAEAHVYFDNDGELIGITKIHFESQ